MLYTNVLEAIGKTPLIKINRLLPQGCGVEVYGKLEAVNPGGSIKERISLSMIEAGEKSGELTKEKIVLEATSGNTGIGLAMVCAAKGYRCMLIMPESASIERRKIMQAYGAEILLTPLPRQPMGPLKSHTPLFVNFPNATFSPISIIMMPTGRRTITVPARKYGSRQEAVSPMWFPPWAHLEQSWDSVPISTSTTLVCRWWLWSPISATRFRDSKI